MSSKLAVVIGANTKNGWPIVKDLLLQEFTVIGLSTSLRSVESLRNQLKLRYRVAFHAYECDLNSSNVIKTTLLKIMQRFPMATEISIHAYHNDDIDRLINASNTLVGSRIIWRRAEIMDSAEIMHCAEKENAENTQIEMKNANLFES